MVNWEVFWDRTVEEGMVAMEKKKGEKETLKKERQVRIVGLGWYHVENDFPYYFCLQ